MQLKHIHTYYKTLGLSHPKDDYGFPWWTMHGRGVLIPEPGLDLTAYQTVKTIFVIKIEHGK